MDLKQLIQNVDELFSKKTSLLALWQEVAENFYPERADFTAKRHLGTDFAANLTTSYPIMCRRELGDQFSAMLRPTGKAWFHMGTVDNRREDNDAKRWLEWAESTMRRAMYDRASRFTRATKEGDHDFAAFGQCAISVEINWKSLNGPHLLYRTWHLRDMVWKEDELGDLCIVARKWKPTAQDLIRLFGDAGVHQKVKDLHDKGKIFEEIECYHIVCDMQMYDGDMLGQPGGVAPEAVDIRSRERYPRVSIYYDVANKHLMQAVPIFGRHYRIPRWQTVSGSQYSYSPATVAALPDARLIQAMTYTLLEAGEKIVNPPMVGQQDVIRSDVALYAGGITWVDQEYDERLGSALRPLTTDAKGMPLGIDLHRDTREMIRQAFFINKLGLPQRAPEMTAYEIGQRVQEWIRGAMPIFEPTEMDYNGAICEETFELLMRGNAFGSPLDMPKSLRGADIEFHFESPLHDAVEQQKGQKWLEAKTILADAAAIDRSAVAMIDAKTALRDVLKGIGVPSMWVRSESDVAEAERQAEAKAQAAEALNAMVPASEAAANIAAARKDLAVAQPA